jgi:hypothetical protein
MLTNDDIIREQIRKCFEEETKTKVWNSQGEVDYEYVLWLEDREIARNNKDFFKGEII